jgi:hypothetical protein
LEYLLGAIITATTILLTYRWFRVNSVSRQPIKVFASQTRTNEMMKSFFMQNESFPKATTQSMKYFDSINLRILIIEEQAYWIKNNTVFVADVINGEIEKDIYSTANLIKNHGDRVFVVWFDNLLEDPQGTLNGIYDFLELERFEHNFEKITDSNPHEDMEGFGIMGLHEIRSKLANPKMDYSKYLSDYSIQKYKNTLDFLWS